MKALPVVVCVCCLAACANPPAPAHDAPGTTTDPSQAGSVTGRIFFEGTPPAPEIIRLDADPNCVELAQGEERRTEDVVLGEGHTLQNVFVYVKEGLPARLYPVPAEPVVLDQQQCRYVPRVFGVQVGQQLIIRNGDALLHNVRAESALNEPFDVGTPIKGMEITRTFATREVMVAVKCNVHSWMHAYAGVVEHPYFAVTDATGQFSIPNLPAGTYTIEAWHERYGTRTARITVTPRETAELTLTYEAA